MIKAARGFVLLQPLAKEETTEGGIFLDKPIKEDTQKGTIVNIGEPHLTQTGAAIPISVKIGETVIFKKYGGEEVKEKGKDYLLVRFEDLLAVLE